MPRTRGTVLPQQPPPPPQRQSPRAPLHLRTTNSDSNGVHAHHRSSPKLEDVHRRSPRSPLPERKRGSKVTDLETKLGHVQEELKKLREQLASAEAAKMDAQHELQEARKKLPTATSPATAGEQAAEEESCVSAEVQLGMEERGEEEPSAEASTPPPQEGKGAEVDSEEATSLDTAAAADSVVEKEGDGGDGLAVEEAVEEKNEGGEVVNEGEGEDAAAAAVVVPEGEETLHAKESQAAAMSDLEAKLEEKLQELERCLSENASLKEQLAEAAASANAARTREEEAAASANAARTREEEAALKLANAAEELAASKARADQLGEQLAAAEGAAAALEAEMKKLKIQTEQWRKAADAAVAALSVTGALGAEGGGGGGRRRAPERCGSMDKHLYAAGEFSGLESPPMGDDADDAWGGAKRKVAGIRMFGDLWKKKGHHNQQQQQQK